MTTSLHRITARLDLETQELLLKAAAIACMPSINSFALSAAIEKAKQIIEGEHSLKLSERDAIFLMNALDKQVTVNPDLKTAYARYASKVQ